MIITLIATLMMPVQYAGILGCGALHPGVFYQFGLIMSAWWNWCLCPKGATRKPAPTELRSNWRHLAPGLWDLFLLRWQSLRKVASTEGVERPAVILRLRQQSQIASTFLELLVSYEEKIRAQGGKLILAGVSPHIKEQLDLTETTEIHWAKMIFSWLPISSAIQPVRL